MAARAAGRGGRKGECRGSRKHRGSRRYQECACQRPRQRPRSIRGHPSATRTCVRASQSPSARPRAAPRRPATVSPRAPLSLAPLPVRVGEAAGESIGLRSPDSFTAEDRATVHHGRPRERRQGTSSPRAHPSRRGRDDTGRRQWARGGAAARNARPPGVCRLDPCSVDPFALVSHRRDRFRGPCRTDGIPPHCPFPTRRGSRGVLSRLSPAPLFVLWGRSWGVGGMPLRSDGGMPFCSRVVARSSAHALPFLLFRF